MPPKPGLNADVTKLIDALQHPLREEIARLRNSILSASTKLQENIKWNGPNYSVGEDDRITMRVQVPKQIQLIFHRGAKKLAQPEKPLMETGSPYWVWKENDRAVVTMTNQKEVEAVAAELPQWVSSWLKAVADQE